MATAIAFSCDEGYVPLVKGLVLSLRAGGLPNERFQLAFIDAGCSEASLAWLRENGVRVTRFSAELAAYFPADVIASPYHLAQVCRPFLPRLFPEFEALLWLDTDLWVQQPAALAMLAAYATQYPDKLFICPEWHYSYFTINYGLRRQHIENLRNHYQPIYGDDIAERLATQPELNCGVFAMAAQCPVWAEWQDEVIAIFGRDWGPRTKAIRHFGEQASLNVIASRRDCAAPVDPLYNYVCAYATPFRDAGDGLLKVAWPPNSPIAVLHLALFGNRKHHYLASGLLYQSGDYLTPEEKRQLFPVTAP